MSPRAKVLRTRTAKAFQAAVRRAAALLKAGQVVAVPTETVYGLAANALDENAVREIFRLKGRPAHNPIIVHVASLQMARRCVAHWPQRAGRLAQAFWPGPLTLVLRRSPSIPEIVTAGGPTVGVRWPSHPFIQALIRECGFPIAAPSANPFARLSPTTAEHVRKTLGDRIALIVDGGPTEVGIESTVLDLSVSPPRLLRPGIINAESLAAVIGPLNVARKQGGRFLKSPGQLPRHYSPEAKLLVLAWKNESDLRAQIARRHLDLARTHILAHRRVPARGDYGQVIIMPHAAAAFARALYAELHRCDEQGAGAIMVEAVPDSPEWQALADRLRRASM